MFVVPNIVLLKIIFHYLNVLKNNNNNIIFDYKLDRKNKTKEIVFLIESHNEYYFRIKKQKFIKYVFNQISKKIENVKWN